MIRKVEAVSFEEVYRLQSCVLWEIRIDMNFSIVEVGFLYLHTFSTFSIFY